MKRVSSAGPNRLGHEKNRAGGVGGSALLLAIGTLLSRILGLIRDALTARYFPVEVRDAFLVAFRLPNIFRRVLGEGALSVGLLPQLVAVRAEKGDEAERDLAGAVGGVIFVLMSTLCLLGLLFMEEIVGVLVGGETYLSVPGKIQRTVALSRIMFGFLILMSAFAFFMTVLQSRKKFLLTALAPCLFNLTMIATALVSKSTMTADRALAWAVLLGGLLQFALLLPEIWRLKLWPHFNMNWSDVHVRKVLVGILPGMFGLGIVQIITLVNLRFAASLPQGTHSYFYFADRLLEFPLSLVVVSIGSALLPTLSHLWEHGKKDEMSSTLNHYFCLILFVALPAATGLFVLSEPIAEVLFVGKEFRVSEANIVADLIQIAAPGLVLLAGVRLLSQGFYAMKNTWYPGVAALVSLIGHVVLAWTLTRKFQISGLAWATTLSSGLHFFMLAAAYNRWVGSLNWRHILRSIVVFAGGCALMGLLLQLHPLLLPELRAQGIPRWVSLGILVLFGGLFYLSYSILMNVPELNETLASLKEKWLKAEVK